MGHKVQLGLFSYCLYLCAVMMSLQGVTLGMVVRWWGLVQFLCLPMLRRSFSVSSPWPFPKRFSHPAVPSLDFL